MDGLKPKRSPRSRARCGAISATRSMPPNKVKSIPRPGRSKVLAEDLCLKLSRTSTATPGAPSTWCGLRQLSTSCTPSRRSPRRVLQCPRRILTSSNTGWLRRNVSTEKGITSMTPRMKKPIKATKGSRNVFADLGLPHPEQELLKAWLTLQIYRIIKERGLTQVEAGKILGIRQPDVSAL